MKRTSAAAATKVFEKSTQKQKLNEIVETPVNNTIVEEKEIKEMETRLEKAEKEIDKLKAQLAPEVDKAKEMRTALTQLRDRYECNIMFGKLLTSDKEMDDFFDKYKSFVDEEEAMISKFKNRQVEYMTLPKIQFRSIIIKLSQLPYNLKFYPTRFTCVVSVVGDIAVADWHFETFRKDHQLHIHKQELDHSTHITEFFIALYRGCPKCHRGTECKIHSQDLRYLNRGTELEFKRWMETIYKKGDRAVVISVK